MVAAKSIDHLGCGVQNVHAPNVFQIFWTFKPQKSFLANKFGNRYSTAMRRPKSQIVELDSTADRLVRLRKYVSGDSQTAFANRVGIEVKRWNNFERGSPLSKDVALTLVKSIHHDLGRGLSLSGDSGMPSARSAAVDDIHLTDVYPYACPVPATPRMPGRCFR